MSSFASAHAYWNFVKIVRTQRRFIFDGGPGDSLAAVRAASQFRSRVLKSGHRLFRAQAGSEADPDPHETGIIEHPLSETRMIPDPKYIKRGGRANPAGFAYLYVATTKETALAEMRPWVGESMTLALFELQKDIKIVVCRAGLIGSIDLVFEENPSPAQVDECVWNDISEAFARPVGQENQEASYIPTQIIAEALKAEGFDGVAYQSGLERGTNVVLFDASVARPMSRCRFVYALKRVRYDFEGVSPYIYYDSKEARQWTEIHTESP